jgi:two-component system copper resistance phosphate regulon response regulator CusR
MMTPGLQFCQVRILLIEDEPKAAAYVRQGLTEAGFSVDVCHDGDAGLAAARREPYDLILCDVMLPKRDGFSLVAELRRAGRAVPLLFVTARDTVDARVRGLDLGADDYLVKPFAFAELLARVRALLRRTPARAPDSYAVGDLICDPRTRRVERGGKRVELSPKEFALLQFLLEHAGEVVSRTLIADRVWDMNFDSDTNVIDVQVRRLRAKIDAHAGEPLIHTVRGVGYVLEDRSGRPA